MAQVSTTTLIELSSDVIGGRVLSVSDEFFAEAFHLLQVQPAKSFKGQFGPKGAIYSGWETRRHNPSHDWCIIKLGVPGSIRAFNLDTSHFNGNEAPAVSVEGLFIQDDEDDDQLDPDDKRWESLLPKVDLGPNAEHEFPALEDQFSKCFSHVKLTMYPDGGIARFRVYGLVQPVFPKDASEVFDLALFSAGGRVVALSDQHFGRGNNLILPGRGKDMGDGWETKRSRAKGHNDWVTIMLGCTARLEHLEIDTNHFLGNYPESAEVHATFSDNTVPEVDSPWTLVLPRVNLGPHRQHFFHLENVENQIFTHIRVTIYPDGGLKRIRVMGRRIVDQLSPTPTPLNETRSPIPNANHSVAPGRTPRITPSSDHPKSGMETTTSTIPAVPLTHEAFTGYGSVIQAYSNSCAAPQGVKSSDANQGSAIKFSHTFATIQSSFPKETDTSPPPAGFAVYRVQPVPSGVPFAVKLLERHPHNNQAFFVVGGGTKVFENDLQNMPARYLVVVAKNGADDKPDLTTLRAFYASTSQGVLYDIGTWHHPLIALDMPTDFACIETQLVGKHKLNCEVIELSNACIEISVPPLQCI